MASRKSDPKQFEGRTGSPGKGQEEGRLERGQGSGNPKTDWDDAPRGGKSRHPSPFRANLAFAVAGRACLQL